MGPETEVHSAGVDQVIRPARPNRIHDNAQTYKIPFRTNSIVAYCKQ
jgi:hypothetical protein